jgi:hypothetical protein
MNTIDITTCNESVDFKELKVFTTPINYAYSDNAGLKGSPVFTPGRSKEDCNEKALPPS